MTGNVAVSDELLIDPTPVWKRRRYFVVLMAFLGLFNVYALRANLSVAIVDMTDFHNVTLENGTTITEQYFDWNSKQKGYVLSSFYYGYLTTQVLGGVLSAKIGGNILFGVGIGATSVLTLLTPMAANMSIYWLIAIRILMGVFEGVSYSSLYEMWSKWAPKSERSRMVSAAFSGNYVGLVISMPLSGFLAAQVSWQSTFYVFGIIGCIWTIFWLIFIRRSPTFDPFISESEKKFIQESLKEFTKEKEVKIPWKEIWTSSAVWALIAATFAEGWGFFTLQTQLPQFLRDALDFDITQSGFLAGLPYLLMAFMLHIAGYLSDFVQIKGLLTTGQTRRYFNSFAFIGQMLCMLFAALFLDRILSVTFVTIGITLAAFAYSSFFVNFIDIAPQFAGVLTGICNSFGVIAGIISPILTGYVVTDRDPEQWKIIFYITAGIYLFGCIIYFIWAQGEVQPWGKVNDEEVSSDEKFNAKA